MATSRDRTSRRHGGIRRRRAPYRLVLAALAALAAVAPLVGCLGQDAGATGAGNVPVTTASEEARRLYLEGRDLEEHLHTTDARRRYLRATELDPDFALAHLHLGLTSGNHDERREAIERAAALTDGVSEGERLLIEAAAASLRGAHGTELATLERLVELHSTDPRARMELARYWFGRKDYEAAIPHYEQTLEIDPTLGHAWNQLGYSYRFVGRLDDAERAFRRYIELTPGEPNPLDSYAELLLTMGRHEASIAEYEKALEVDPTFAESYVGIGNNLVFLGRIADARLTFQHLLTVARDERQRRIARRWIATTYLHEDNPGKALAVVRELVDISLANGDLVTAADDVRMLGEIQLHAGDPDGALDSFEQSLALMRKADLPHDMLARMERRHIYHEGRVALARGDVEGARASASAFALAVTGGEPYELSLRHELEGRIALATGDHEAAVTALRQADVDNLRIAMLLAEACRGAGDRECARDLGQRIAEYRGLDMGYAFVRSRARGLVADL